MNNDGGKEANLSARTLTGISWSYLSAFSRALLSLLFLMILVRLLTPSDYGLLGIALIFVTLGLRFGQAGVGPAVVQRAELTPLHIRVGFTLSVVFGVAMTAILWLLAPWIGGLFNEPVTAQILRALSVVFIIEGIGVMPSHLLRRALRFRQLMVANTLSYSLGYGLVAVILAFQGFGVWSLVCGEIMRRTIYTALVFRYSPLNVRPYWAFREAAQLLSRGAGFSLYRVFEFVSLQGGYFVIGYLLGAAALGYYTQANRFVMVSRNYVSHSLFEVLFPAMAQRQQGTARLAVIYAHGIEILSLLALPIGVLLLMCAPEIIPLILGQQWLPVIILLQILAIAVLFHICDLLNAAVISAVGAVGRQAWRQGLHAFLVVGGAWYASRWGLQGVAVAIVVSQIIAYLLMTRLAVSILELRWRHFLRCYLPALWAGAWVILALWLTTAWTRDLSLPVGAALLIELLVWSATLLAAVYLAPALVRPRSADWIMSRVPFEVLGVPGTWIRTGLKWLLRGQESH